MIKYRELLYPYGNFSKVPYGKKATYHQQNVCSCSQRLSLQEMHCPEYIHICEVVEHIATKIIILEYMCNKGSFRKKCPYSEFFSSVFSVFSPNARKYGPEKLRIRTLFTQKEPRIKQITC